MQTGILKLCFQISAILLLLSPAAPRPHQQHWEAPTCNILDSFCREPDLSEYGGYSGIARSGYMKLPKTGSGLGFSFFGAQGVIDKSKLGKIPTIIVLGGGPGASSQFNSLMEMGPLNLKKIFAISVVKNEATWALSYNLLFIDQPVGTGVSCLADPSHIPTTMKGVIDDLYYALNELYTPNGCFTSLGIPPSAPFFIFGESYGGKYAPALGVRLLEEQKNKGVITGLKGIGIGDGFTAPFKILSELGNHAFSMGLLDYQQRMHVQKIILKASLHYESQEWVKLKEDFWQAIDKIEKCTGISKHDITQESSAENLVEEFFANSTKLTQFGFEPSNPFRWINKEVFEKLAGDYMKDQSSDVERLLGAGLPVLVYQGQDDLIVSPSGTIKWVDELNYSESKKFRNSNLAAWTINGKIVGSSKSAGKLTLTIVHNTGHFAPVRAPLASYQMAKQFIEASL